MNKHFTKRRQLSNKEKQELLDMVRTTYSNWIPKEESNGNKLRLIWFSIVDQLKEGWLSDKQIAVLKRCKRIAEETRINKFIKATGDIEKALKLKRAIQESLEERKKEKEIAEQKKLEEAETATEAADTDASEKE